MKNIFISVVVLFSALQAKTISLEDIEEKLQKAHPLHLSLKEQELSNSAKSKANFARTPIVLQGGTTRANPLGEDSELEYSVGAQKTFIFGNKRNLEISNLNNLASSLELKKELLAFNNELKMLYHQSCLEKTKTETYEKLYRDFEKLFAKKQKAYEYKEISKKEILQLQIEKEDLKQRLQGFKADKSISKSSLFKIIGVDDSKAKLYCQDLHPMEFTQDDEKALFTLSKEALNSQILATKKSTKLYDRNFESVDLSLGYDNEIDMKKYGVGISLPLSFTSDANEYKKVSALHKQKALRFKKESLLLRKNQKFEALKAKLQNSKKLILMVEENIKIGEDELSPLIEKSYQLGESSVVLYLLEKQKLWQLYLTLNDYKKRYYQTLFELYTVAELKGKK